jgi:hypothetical protein
MTISTPTLQKGWFLARLAVIEASWLDCGMSLVCYAQRLLNPFRGVVNVIKYQSAEAVTLDGVHWDIYVANEALSVGLNGRAQISDIRYGSWSEAAGLKRGPIYPSDDFKRMEMQGHIVYEYLRAHHREVPFAFKDRYELWLLDSEHRPLALIHSVLSLDETRTEISTQWRAGFAAEEQFCSAASGDDNSASCLGSYINSRARGWQWIERNENGGGTGLGSGKGGVAGRLFEADLFPVRFLFRDRHEAPFRQLVADYLNWQAPWLLLLDTLSEQARRELEMQARARAAEMVRQHRLYPAVADPAQIKAALVEMVLREKQPEREDKSNPGMSPFYIELNPQGGGYT